MKTILKRFLVLILILLFIPAMFLYIPTFGIGGGILLGICWVLTGNNVEDYIDSIIIPVEPMYKLIKRILQ